MPGLPFPSISVSVCQVCPRFFAFLPVAESRTNSLRLTDLLVPVESAVFS